MRVAVLDKLGCIVLLPRLLVVAQVAFEGCATSQMLEHRDAACQKRAVFQNSLANNGVQYAGVTFLAPRDLRRAANWCKGADRPVQLWVPQPKDERPMSTHRMSCNGCLDVRVLAKSRKASCPRSLITQPARRTLSTSSSGKLRNTSGSSFVM